MLPATVWGDQAIFAEAHGEFTNFWKTLQRLLRSGNTTATYSGYPERTDLSFGGGYRKLLGDSLMLGVNGFYDTTKLGSRWYGSGGLGFEMAALGAGSDLVELTFNYYGDIFQGRNSIINAFRNGPSNFDVSARYSVELGDFGPDLRLKATGYQFDSVTRQYGWNTEAEVRTRNGMFSVKAGTGHDPVNGWYHTVGGFVNVGLDFANLLRGGSPFEMPEPIFRSPRNLRRVLTQKVERNYESPPHRYALTASAEGPCSCDGTGLGDLVYGFLVSPGTILPGQVSTCDNGPDWTPAFVGDDYTVLLCVQNRNGTRNNIVGFSARLPNCSGLQQAPVISPGSCQGIFPFRAYGTTAFESWTMFNDSTQPYNPGLVTVRYYHSP